MKKKILVVVLILTFIIPSNALVFSESMDLKYMDQIFDKVRNSSDFKRQLYVDALQGAFSNEKTLETFANNFTDYLLEDDLEKMNSLGITKEEVKENILALKTWERSDRLKIIEYIQMKDQVEGKRLLEELNNSYVEENPSGDENNSNINTNEEDNEQRELLSITLKERLSKRGLIVNPIEIIDHEKTFKDISDHWSEENVKFFAKRGIINGRTVNEFDPDGIIKENEILALLMRLVIEDVEKIDVNKIELDDSNKNKWYSENIKQAKALKILSNMELNPEQYPSRQKIIQLIYNVLISLEVEVSDEDKINNHFYNDFSKVDKEYREAIIVSSNLGLIQGNDDNTLAPNRTISRAETITILKRVYDLIIFRINDL